MITKLSFLLLALAMLLGQGQLFAQSCRQVELATTPQKGALLQEYIKDCNQKRYFFEDKGAVKLIVYQNTEGATCWYLSAIIDDRYQTLPPEEYTFYGNTVILVYHGDSASHLLPIKGDAVGRDMCIQEVLGSRVYKHTTEKQFVYSRDASGKVQKVPVNYLSGGNLNNSLIVKFNKDGTVSKSIPV